MNIKVTNRFDRFAEHRRRERIRLAKNESSQRTIDADRLVVNQIEERLRRSRTQLEQEELLQLLRGRLADE